MIMTITFIMIILSYVLAGSLLSLGLTFFFHCLALTELKKYSNFVITSSVVIMYQRKCLPTYHGKVKRLLCK